MRRSADWIPPGTPFALEHVAARGVTADMLATAARNGRITRLLRGVYVETAARADDLPTRHVQLALAHQVRRPDLVASHHTAALASGVALADPRAAEREPRFLLPTRAAVRSEVGSARVGVAPLPRAHRVVHPCGLLMTVPARTGVDVARRLDLPDSLITLDSVARLLLIERVGSSRLRDHYANERRLDAIRAELAEAACLATTRGPSRALLTAIGLADARRESPLESLSFGEMCRVGLPLPVLQHRIETDLGVFFADFAWPERMVLGEADGLVKYTRPEDAARERVREGALRDLGFQVIRWTWNDMRLDPIAVLRRLKAALDLRVG